jgi:addiction module RelE/StbE family toxin
MDYKVVLTASSRRDLKDIVRYISLDNPELALQFGRQLIQHTKGLSEFPEKGRVVPEFHDESIREIIVKHFRIVYRINHKTKKIQVLRFWHARRGIPMIARY